MIGPLVQEAYFEHVVNWNMLGDSDYKWYFGFDGLFNSPGGLMGGNIDACCVRLEMLHGL